MLQSVLDITTRLVGSFVPMMGPSSAAMPSTAPWADYWYQSMGLPGLEGIMGGDDAYQFSSACFAATRLLAGVGSRMPLNRVKTSETKDGQESMVLRRDSVHRLLNFQANPDQTSMAFRSMMVEWQVNRGTCFAWIEREVLSGRPSALWPIHPVRCRPFRSSEDGSLWWHVRNGDGTETDIPDVDMLRVPYTILDRTGLCGIGVSVRASQTILLAQNLDRTENDSSMSGVPRIVVEAPNRMNLPEQNEFRRQWKELYTRSTGENVALLVGGMKATPLSWSATDSQHNERRKTNVEDIATWYDVPLTLLRRAIKESAGNVEQLGQEFQTYSLAFLEMWEQEASRKLLTEADRDAGQSFDLDYKSLLRADHVARAQRASALVPVGALNSNEVRADEGLNPYPDGKQYFVQGALRPINEPYNAKEPQNPPIEPTTGKRDPLKTPKSPKAQALKVGARTMLEDCLRRLTHKEAQAAQRAAKKPGEWMSWIDDFYADHAVWAASELKLPLEVCSVFGVTNDPTGLAGKLAETSKQALLEVADGDRESFGARVETLTAEWERDRAAAYVRTIAELN